MQQNRYEKFVKLLIKQTNDGVANWELIKPQSLPFVIEQSDWINRSFRCRDFESAKGSDIYLIGQVVPNFQNSGGVEFDRFNLYVYLFKDGKIVKIIDDFEVDENVLNRLYSAVEDNSDEVDEIFKDFE
ncbi:MAG: hypothetical protein COV37_05020 [Bdellovibrio sp. CG11_big_fil_rev_8_21_14_0_20_39_38]|nr:MAG: hypothetical protein COW78_10635 [Bdellovibrio sp. CG22_combo_CG10-13_8_21_14_all_39_27]PIR36108.1 MAG: hypothetical protein COV37_05020 [Bdellovibrio sp. CG11_big_fil_rev_8_21_14_0_20_39_38]